MSRLCMRPGCDRDAAARLTYDPVGCEVWLDDLFERVGRHQEICGLHAERLTVPRGWVLSDRRADEPTMFVAPAAATPAPVPAAPRRSRRRSGGTHPATQTLELFEVLRKELAEAEADQLVQPDQVVQPEPEPEVEPEPEPGAAVVEPESAHEDLPESLQATSPLLARAFAATGHQRSVLTQRGPRDPAEPAPTEE